MPIPAKEGLLAGSDQGETMSADRGGRADVIGMEIDAGRASLGEIAAGQVQTGETEEDRAAVGTTGIDGAAVAREEERNGGRHRLWFLPGCRRW